MRCLIFGNGFIGNKIRENIEGSVIANNYIHSEHDIIVAIETHNPEVIINCIGKTGRPNIDWCEMYKIETLFSNVTVPLMIAKVCQERDIRMVHIGTGCIYSSSTVLCHDFKESDEPNYIGSYYSKTKYLCERLLLDFNILQLRIRMPIDCSYNQRNLVNKLFSYDRVINIKNSITVLDDFIYALQNLIKKGCTGVFNVVNPDPVTHKEIIEIFEPYIGKFNGVFIKPDELIMKAGRSNCVLNTDKLSKYNSLSEIAFPAIKLRPTKEALLDCAKRYEKSTATV